uniref:SOCS box domain-containing protein n=1 Tax=Amphimedon queenslandica TaxID=400682 RepID=A0A1X7TQH1_AMPQE
MSKSLTVDNSTIKFQIWDTAGQERYRSLLPMYYRNAAAAIVVYDITNEGSFTVLQDWIAELHRLGPPNIVLAIAGNKCDLEDIREIPAEQGQTYASEVNAIFGETSALTARNVEKMFIEITRKLPPDCLTSLPAFASLLRQTDTPRAMLREDAVEEGEGTKDHHNSSFIIRE